MRLNREKITITDLSNLFHWIDYCIADINSWEELTPSERILIPKDLFNRITCK